MCALSKRFTLISDDIKLIRHGSEIDSEFSTFFLIVFVNAEILTKTEALEKLEEMREIRNWQDNIIYLVTKESLD